MFTFVTAISLKDKYKFCYPEKGKLNLFLTLCRSEDSLGEDFAISDLHTSALPGV